jgi:hypothetical protein
VSKRLKGFAGLLAALQADLPAVREHVLAGAKVAAVETLPVVAANMPDTDGELARALAVTSDADAVHLTADAPHAAAVEVGARPHLVPLHALVRWIQVKRLATRGESETALALAIQRRISREGTPPRWFMRRSLDAARLALAEAVPRALRGAP